MSANLETTLAGEPMNVFLDTEFSSLSAPALLSIGLVADDGRECYAEIADRLLPVNAFVMRTVLPQWGLMPGRVASKAELGRRVDAWLSGLGQTSIAVVYDYEADFELLQDALVSAVRWGRWSMVLVPRKVGFLSRQALSDEAMDSSWAASLHHNGIGRHHALADARALRAGYQAIREDRYARMAESRSGRLSATSP